MKVDAPALNAVLASLQQAPPSGRFLLALSGGVDSLVLLHLLHDWRDALQPRQVAAIHINHQLHPDAAQWASLCQHACDRLAIPLEIVQVQVAGKAGPEGNAREARYQAIAHQMHAGDVVLTAHHRDDQVETLLLNLLRGSGLRGLAGMPDIKPFAQGWLMRPLLPLGREQILAYAQQQNLHWVADPSNSDEQLARNFLRHSVVPLLQQRWPAAAASIATSASLLQQADTLLSASLDSTVRQLADQAGQLDCALLLAEPVAQQAELLRHWCRAVLHSTPPRRQLLEFLRQVADTEEGQPLLCWSDCLIGRHQARLIAHRQLPDFPPDWQSDWQGQQSLMLPGGLGRLELLGQPDLPLRVAFRQGGERMLSRGMHHDLKTLFQTLAIPPWLRHAVPLVYCGQQLCALADLLRADNCPDFDLVWHRGESWPKMLQP